jgi:hypothetical protein
MKRLMLVALVSVAVGCKGRERTVLGPTPVEPTPAPITSPQALPTHKPHPPAPPIEATPPAPVPPPGKPKPAPTPAPKCRAHEPNGPEQCKE